MQKDVELEQFQNEVWDEYKSYRSLFSSRNFEKDLISKAETSKDSIWYCFIYIFIWIFTRLLKKAIKEQEKKRGYIEFEKESSELRSDSKIKEAICFSITNIPKGEILTEEKFVKTITDAISQPELVKRYVIPRNPILYAIIAYQIFQAGIENYCNS